VHFEITQASAADAPAIAGMAVALTGEISRRMGVQHFDLDLDGTAALCARTLAEGSYAALLATVGDRPVGFVGLSQGCALYAGGAIGTMQEFYVAPDFRSGGIGAALIEAVKAHARTHGWRRIEVCTPPLPEFDASLRFYQREGFEISGGRKLKAIV
jgi:GNAT superfamily N-acetyltransferase